MKLTRREFLKAAAAALILGPSILEAQNKIPIVAAPKLKLAGAGNLNFPTAATQFWGRNLRMIWEATNLHHRMTTLSQTCEPDPMVVCNGLLGRSAQLSADPQTLTFLGQITDSHLLDEESPGRMVAAELFLEGLGVGSAFHPQEDLTFQVLDSMIATFNQIISSSQQFDLLLNTGDSIDNDQYNELSAFFQILEGGLVDPDSGTDEDPVIGPNNDANDLFVAQGLNRAIPYYTAVGNHDVLVQGNIPPLFREAYNAIVTKIKEEMAVLDSVGNWSNAILTPWAIPPDPHTFKPGNIIPDAARRFLVNREFLTNHLQHASQRPVFGFPKNLPCADYGYYSFYPKAGVPLRMVVLDTALRLGTAIGAIHETQYKDFLIPQLEDAKAKNELVVIVSHHPGASIKTLPVARAEMLARYQRDAALYEIVSQCLEGFENDTSHISRAQFEDTLKSYPNVILHIAGHRHCHEIRQVGEPGHGYWEIQTASLLTYPQQSRVIEIVNEGTQIGAIHTSVVDHQSAPDSLAARSRLIAYQDAYGMKAIQHWLGDPQDRNAILRFPIPAEIAKKL